MGRSKTRCREGDCLLIPLSEDHCAIGVVARVQRDGLLLGYFFISPVDFRLDECASKQERLNALKAVDADLVCICTNRGIVTGTWQIIGSLADWNKDSWPYPVFGEVDPLVAGVTWIVNYDEEKQGFVRRQRVSREVIVGLPEAAIFGHGAVQLRLAKLSGIAADAVSRSEKPGDPPITVSVSERNKHLENDQPSSKSTKPGVLAAPLRALLDGLDAVAESHDEVSDTAVREHLRAAIEQGFIKPVSGFKLPRKFGMFSPQGSRRVREVLASFLESDEIRQAKASMSTTQERLDAFQDINVESANGSTYDEYFGSDE